jgi:hypothetical protein
MRPGASIRASIGVETGFRTRIRVWVVVRVGAGVKVRVRVRARVRVRVRVQKQGRCVGSIGCHHFCLQQKPRLGSGLVCDWLAYFRLNLALDTYRGRPGLRMRTRGRALTGGGARCSTNRGRALGQFAVSKFTYSKC